MNASCTINVTFNPTATGARTATVVLTDNDPSGPQNVPLSGTGTTGSAALTTAPSSVTFSSEVVGMTSAAQTITITSTGTAPLSISSIVLTGTNPEDFAQTNDCPTAFQHADGKCLLYDQHHLHSNREWGAQRHNPHYG